ncbi:hypothetical protein AUP68_07464 [Ilyonectria robusta]
MLSASQRLAAEERKERKRVQNRLNQRARRQRAKDKEGNSAKPFRVDRWRLGEDSGPSTQTSPHDVHGSEHVANDGQALRHAKCPTLQSLTQVSGTTSRVLPALQPASTRHTELPLPTDHALIHLINQNVCRGFMENKTILKLRANFINAVQNPPLPSDIAAA